MCGSGPATARSADGAGQKIYICAEVAELAYAQVSEACAARLEGSNPSFRTSYCDYSMRVPPPKICFRLGGGVPPKAVIGHTSLFQGRFILNLESLLYHPTSF